MTTKEKKQIDAVLVRQVLAGVRGVDKTKMLNAFAYDIGLIREGKDPVASQDLI